MTQTELTVRAPDGRSLDVLVTGPADGLPLVFHHGTPGGVAVYGPIAAAAEQCGLRLVLYGRPGYGNSTPQPGRSVADAAADVAAILDELDAAEFVTAGWSGGGPHALACGRLLAGRCVAVACIAGVAPYDAEDLDWLAGMAEDNVQEFTTAAAGEAGLTRLLGEFAPVFSQLSADQLAEGMGDLASPVDKAALDGELATYLLESFRAGLAPGVAGWRDDDLAFVRPWGFPAAGATTVPVTVWQGDEDHMVPFAHGQWLAAHIPAARAHLLPGQGHLSLPVGEIIEELAGLAASRSRQDAG
jgi:pimeloyl-ACP methyl ester carboxylesterase